MNEYLKTQHQTIYLLGCHTNTRIRAIVNRAALGHRVIDGSELWCQHCLSSFLNSYNRYDWAATCRSSVCQALQMLRRNSEEES